MGKIALLFAGQGDQYPGMGKDWYDKYEIARKAFDTFDILRPDTTRQCFEGSEEELKSTINTQPCLFATEYAGYKILESYGIKADTICGYSLGEVTALTVAGAFDIQSGFELVCQRARYMQEAANKADTSMVAVVRLSDEQVEKICSQFDNIYPVNYNCPGQVSVAGDRKEMAAFASSIKEAGGRALPLKVSAAFHSPYMQEAASKFKEILMKTTISKMQIPVYANKTASPYILDDAVDILSSQIDHPVLFEKIISNMINDGIDTFIEIGPGMTLTKMVSKIDSDVKAMSIADIDAVLRGVGDGR